MEKGHHAPLPPVVGHPARIGRLREVPAHPDTPGRPLDRGEHPGRRKRHHDSGRLWHLRRAGINKLELIPAGKDVHWSFRVERQLPSGGLNKSSAGGAIQLNSPADPWFVFAESPTRLWFFNGSDTLAYTVKDEHVSSGGQAISGGNLQNGAPRIPTEVIRKLPAPLQQLFPPVPPAGPKPSI